MSLKPYDDIWARRRRFRADPFWDMNLMSQDLMTSSSLGSSSIAPLSGRRFRSERISDMERKFDEMVRKVDARFSGILSLLGDEELTGKQKVEVEHEGKQLAPAQPKAKDFSLKIDVQDFRPEEVKVKVQGGQVFVHAKRENKNEDDGMYAYSFREFKRAFTVPQDVNVELLTSSLTSEGILQIDAPAKTSAVGAIEAAPRLASVPVTVEHGTK